MANRTERIGVNHCGEIAERNNWMFREQPVNDIGIDAHMEITETTGEPKQLIALQIKSGASWFGEKKDDCVIFRNINERQYNYWTMNSLPCIVVLYNPDDDTCIWQKLTAETIERTNDGKGKGFFVRVPLNQIFLNNKKAFLPLLLAYSDFLRYNTVNYRYVRTMYWNDCRGDHRSSARYIVRIRRNPMRIRHIPCRTGNARPYNIIGRWYRKR